MISSKIEPNNSEFSVAPKNFKAPTKGGKGDRNEKDSRRKEFAKDSFKMDDKRDRRINLTVEKKEPK